MIIGSDPTIPPKDYKTTIILSKNSGRANIYTNEKDIMVFLRESNNFNNKEKYIKTVGQKNMLVGIEGTMELKYLTSLINKFNGVDING